MIEAGHFVEVENILRLTLRETMLVSRFASSHMAWSDDESSGAETIKYPQISSISQEIKSNKMTTRKKELLKMASKHLSFLPL
jgi:hypothetical protein